MNKLANRLTEYCIRQNLISIEDAPYYSFTFVYIFENVLYLFFIFTIGLLLHMGLISLVIIFVLFPIRGVCGGFHFKSRKLCTVLSLFVPLIILLSIKFISLSPFLLAIFYGLSISILLFTSPVETENKKILPPHRKKLRMA